MLLASGNALRLTPQVSTEEARQVTNDTPKTDRRTCMRRGAMGAAAMWALALGEFMARGVKGATMTQVDNAAHSWGLSIWTPCVEPN